jgi:uncharacterized membrane protein YkvA (DUF1232 family)
MRAVIPTITEETLPFTGDYESAAPLPPGLSLRADEVARFDALLRELYPDALRVDPLRVRNLCFWLASLPPQAAQDVLDRRLRRMEQLRAMLDDDGWDADESIRTRLRMLFAYIDREDDLIPDREPLIGKLDDVLLIELAWPAFAAEAEEYLDFCQYRAQEHPVGDGAAQRDAWIRDRLAEIALWQHHMRVNESHYAGDNAKPQELFHIL